MFLNILNVNWEKKYRKVESHHTYLCPRAVKNKVFSMLIVNKLKEWHILSKKGCVTKRDMTSKLPLPSFFELNTFQLWLLPTGQLPHFLLLNEGGIHLPYLVGSRWESYRKDVCSNKSKLRRGARSKYPFGYWQITVILLRVGWSTNTLSCTSILVR